MEERQAAIRRERDRTLQQWSAGAAFLGAVIFLLLSPLDFFAIPSQAPRFLVYRIAIAALLTGCGALLRRPRSRATTQMAVFVGTLASAATLEAMILVYGGHESPYLIGLILLGVTVLGLIPGSLAFASLLAGAIFLVYLAPLALAGPVGEPGSFAVRTVLFVAILITGVLISWLHWRRIGHEIALRHDLTQSRIHLEEEAARRSRSDVVLRENQGLLSSIASAVMDAIVMIDPEGTVRYWNPAAEQIFGYPASEAVGRGPFVFLVAPELGDALLADHRAWLATGADPAAGRRIVTRGRRSDGETFPMELTMSAVERDGRLWTCALLRDVTDQARAEERLRLFAAAIEGAAEGFFIVGLDGRFLYVNPAISEIFGLEPASFIGRPVAEFQLDHSQATDVIIPEIMRRGSWAGEIMGKGRTGEPFPVWLTGSLVRNDAGQPIAMVGITKDLSGQKRREEERIRTQKLESIGVLAGGLAHDFNNLLTIILGNLDLARLQLAGNPEAAEALDHAGEAAQRAGDLTRQLITFSKGGQPVKRVGSIARTVRETVAFAAAGSSISCSFELPEELPPVEFDEGQMRQVIHNLVQNAREAMPDGGALEIGACARQLGEGEIPGLPAGRYLLLQFRDRGSGIDQAHLSRIFDPYFSTKAMDAVKGRGLGLAVSFSIVRNHGGTMTAESAVAAGTTISVYLPESRRRPEEGDEEDDLDPVGGGAEAETFAEPAAPEPERVPEGPARGRVLVMDDEPLVLEMAGAFLRRLGYAATLARSGAAAVVQYQIGLEGGKRFDAVILDLTVPGGPGGPETLARLREIDPGVRAILSSGHVDHPVVADWAGAGFAAFIGKPYSIKALEETLARLL